MPGPVGTGSGLCYSQAAGVLKNRNHAAKPTSANQSQDPIVILQIQTFPRNAIRRAGGSPALYTA